MPQNIRPETKYKSATEVILTPLSLNAPRINIALIIGTLKTNNPTQAGMVTKLMLFTALVICFLKSSYPVNFPALVKEG